LFTQWKADHPQLLVDQGPCWPFCSRTGSAFASRRGGNTRWRRWFDDDCGAGLDRLSGQPVGELNGFSNEGHSMSFIFRALRSLLPALAIALPLAAMAQATDYPNAPVRSSCPIRPAARSTR
jgi:hypothetical protein